MPSPHFPTRLSFALVATACLGLGACDKLADAVQKGAEAAAQSGVDAAGAGMSEDDKLGVKLNDYIACINDESNSVHRSEESYARWVDFEKGLDPATKRPGSVYDIGDPQDCLDGIAKAKAEEPKLDDVEAAAEAYATALSALLPITKDAHKYYDEKNYKDDEFKKGIELDPKLRAAYKAFNEAYGALRTSVRTHNEALHERELVRIEKEQGRKLSFLTRLVMQKSKHLVGVLHTGDNTDFFEGLDLAKMETEYKAFESAVDELNTYAEAHKKEADSIMMFSSFTSDAKELKKEIKALMRRKRDNKPFTAKETKEAAKNKLFAPGGHPVKIYEQHDELIKSSNNLSWSRYQPE